ncbi:MAG: tyrosine--tRNA ligase [Parcubacteria group bacterium]|jgi:tyrosyl-tRNA synthetase|nr:tyrosine--tRNA ligase [Parcubacteria group bacterium]
MKKENKNILDELLWRGLINQTTDEKELKKRLEKPIVLYCGFDVTADSFHVGHLLPIVTLKRFAQYNHQAISLLGNGTSLIGDPSGKNTERQLNSEEKVNKWSIALNKQLEQLFAEEITNKKAIILKNKDWLEKLTMLSFIREIGKYFSVGYMMAKESVKTRLETGISFTEFSYMLLQAYDFFWLNKNYNCELQIGGSDQWGNLTAGIDLIAKKSNKVAYGITVPLLLKSDGTKFGKTEGGAIWLDSQKTSPYQFYQFFINTDDKDVIKLLKQLTFLSQLEINELEKITQKNPEQRQAQKTLAEELTKFIHGEKALRKVQKITKALFSNDFKSLNANEIKEALSDVPSYIISNKKELNIIDLLTEAGISSSKRQAKEDVLNRAISLNGKTISDINYLVTKKDCLIENILIFKRGKKNHFLIYWQ